MSLSSITISKNNAKLTITVIIGALVGSLLGWVVFAHPALSPSAVPPAALQVAYKAGSAILQGTAPDNLPEDIFTGTFLYQYQTDYPAFIQPMSTTGIAWTATPVITWSGNNYIDVCLIAKTQAGTVAIEMRLIHTRDTWAVNQLLLLQLREAK